MRFEIERVNNGYIVDFVDEDKEGYEFQVEQNVFHTIDDVREYLKIMGEILEEE